MVSYSKVWYVTLNWCCLQYQQHRTMGCTLAITISCFGFCSFCVLSLQRLQPASPGIIWKFPKTSGPNTEYGSFHKETHKKTPIDGNSHMPVQTGLRQYSLFWDIGPFFWARWRSRYIYSRHTLLNSARNLHRNPYLHIIYGTNSLIKPYLYIYIHIIHEAYTP